MPEQLPSSDNNQQESNLKTNKVEPFSKTPINSFTSAPLNNSNNQVIVRKNKKYGFMAVLIIVLLLIVIAVGAYLLVKNSKSSKIQNASVTKKDIPLFTYGGTSGEVPNYPIQILNNTLDGEIVSQEYEGLTGYKDQTKIVPLLATSWSNPNETTWIFNIRHNVKFHTGRTMNANDVKFTLDYAVAHQNDDSGNSNFLETSTISKVNVINPYQISVITKSPDPVLLNRLFFVGIFDSHAKLGDPNAGTGPYLLKPGTTPTASTIDLVATNNYWQGHIYTKEIKFTEYTDIDQMVKDTVSGKLSYSGDFTINQLKKIKNYRPIFIPTQGSSFIAFNTNKTGSPLQSITARQAATFALNKQAILNASGLQGKIVNQLVPIQIPGHNPAIQDSVFDPAKAKQLLSTVKNANAPLTYAYPAGDDPQVLEAIKELNAVGFNIKPLLINDFGAFVVDTANGKYDLFTLSYNSNTVDGLDIISQVLQGNKNYDSSHIDSIISIAGSTLDPSTRLSEMQKADTIIDTEKPLIPLYDVNSAYVLTNKSYSLINPDIPANGPYIWKIYQQ